MGDNALSPPACGGARGGNSNYNCSTKKIVTEPAVRIVYTSPCGRVTVERHGNRDYLALLDSQPCGFFSYAFEAEAPINISLRLALQIGAAFERNQQKIGLTRRQVFTLMDIAATIIEREMPRPTFVEAA